MQVKVIKFNEIEKVFSSFLEEHQNECYIAVDNINELIEQLQILSNDSKSYAIVENANFIHYLDTKKEHSN